MDLRLAHVGPAEIARRLNLSRGVVSGILQRAGMSLPMLDQYSDCRDEILKLEAEGLSARKIGALLSIKKSQVAGVIRRAGVKPKVERIPSIWNDETLALMHELYIVQGLTARETGERLGVTERAIIGRAYRAGWKRDPELCRNNLRKAERKDRAKSEPRQPRQPRKPRKVRAAPSPLDSILSPNARPWEEREPGQCGWPLGERGAYHSCCNPVEEKGARYCQPHASVAFVGTPEPRALSKVAGWVSRMERPRAAA
jgi:hypothetical protein